MKKLLMVVLALALLGGGAMGQEVAPAEPDLEITESATPSPEEPEEDVQVEERESLPEPETGDAPHVEEAPEAEDVGNVSSSQVTMIEVRRTPAETMTERFGDSWTQRPNRVISGRTLRIPRDKAVGELVVIVGGVELEGYANDVVTILGSIELGEEAIVRGELVSILGNIVVKEGATVDGEAVSILGSVIDPGEGVKGDTVAISGPIAYVVPALAGPTIVTLFLLELLNVVASLLLAYLVVALMPGGIIKIGDQLVRNPLVSGLVGGGALVALPLLFIILAITCIGILLVPLAFVIAWVVAQTVVAHRIGYMIRSAVRRNSYRPYIDVTIGMLLLALIPLVPVVGWVVKLVLVMAGLGAVVLTRFGSRDGIGLVPVPAVAPVASSEHVDEQVEPAE